MSILDPELFRLTDEEYESCYASAFEYDYSIYTWNIRRIFYNDKRQVFSLPGDRNCQNGIRNNNDLGNYICVTYSSSLDSNFLTISEAVLDEVKKVYPSINCTYISSRFIKFVIPEFVRFYKDNSIVESPPIKTRFKIASMRVGFSRVKIKYKDDNISKVILELLAYNIYLA